MDLSYTLGQIQLKDIYRTICPTAREYTLFSSVYGTFSKIDYMFKPTANVRLNKFRKIQIISITFSDHVVMKLYIRNRKMEYLFKCVNITNTHK